MKHCSILAISCWWSRHLFRVSRASGNPRRPGGPGTDRRRRGCEIDALDRTLVQIRDRRGTDRVKFVYTIPEHANPTGISLAAERRKPLVDLVRRWSTRRTGESSCSRMPAYHGFSYGVQEPQSLWSLDPDGETVILARTFSKTLARESRSATGSYPGGLSNPILRLKGNHDFGSANFNQQLLERCWPAVTTIVMWRRLRELYGRKRDVFWGPLSNSWGRRC